MVFGRITRVMFEWFLYRDFYIILLLIILEPSATLFAEQAEKVPLPHIIKRKPILQ